MADSSSENLQSTEFGETRSLVEHGFALARELGIHRVLVFSELISDRKLVEKHRDGESILWVSRDAEPLEDMVKKKDCLIHLPASPAERIEQVNLAIITAVLNQDLSEHETVLCLAGVAGSKRLDNLLIVNPKRDFSWFSKHSMVDGPKVPDVQAFIRLLELALKFAEEGREGKPVGTIFLLGEVSELETLVRPLILNPCHGHPRKMRSIYDDEFTETLRELSALDGAFVIDPKGVVEQAGVYLNAPATKKVKVKKGLGSRHVAAAAATARKECLALVISESSGKVTVFSEGEEVISLSRNSGP